MEHKPKFRVVYTDEAMDFLDSLPAKAREKVAYNIAKSMFAIDKEIFKKLVGADIWEFRTIFNNIQYRLFAFWDTDGDTLVVATHGIIKKTQKTPAREIARAEAIRKNYFNDKNGKKR